VIESLQFHRVRRRERGNAEIDRQQPAKLTEVLHHHVPHLRELRHATASTLRCRAVCFASATKISRSDA
jgi:hypothetical protein